MFVHRDICWIVLFKDLKYFQCLSVSLKWYQGINKKTLLWFQDREFVEMEVPYNGAPKRPGSPSPLTSPAHSTASRGGLLQSCCGRCYPQRYQVRGRRILASTTSISEGPPSSSSHSHQSQTTCQNPQASQLVDPTTVPNVAFNFPGEDRRRQGTSTSSPYNETRVWAELAQWESTDTLSFKWSKKNNRSLVLTYAFPST